MVGGELISERLVRDFGLVVEFLRMASTVKDYVHDELLRCDDVDCVAEALYRVGRRYFSDSGLKALYRRVAGLYEGSLGAVFHGCAGEAERDPEALAEEVWAQHYGRLAKSYADRVADLIKWLESIVREGKGEEFKKVLTILATISFAPGYVRLPARCFEGKSSPSSGGES